MKPKEVLIALGKSLIVYGFAALAFWWTWEVSNSLFNLCKLFYRVVDTTTLFQAVGVIYAALVFITLIIMNVHVKLYPPQLATPRMRLIRKVIMSCALVPGLNMLLPLGFFGWGIFYVGIHGSAYAIVLLEQIYC